VELTGPLLALPGCAEGAAATPVPVPGRSSRPVTRGEGSLVEQPGGPVRPRDPDEDEGEPL
jgi:hypothetical protein